MPVDVVVPELGESVTEAILVEWLKKDGEAVEADEAIAVLETDKADVELPAPVAGVLQHLKAEGDTIAVGEAMGRVDEAGEAKAPKAGEKAPEPEPEKKEEAESAGDALSPAVRRLVEENKLDASKIKGTGKGGRLIKEDVLTYIEAQKKKEKQSEPPKPEAKPIPKPAAQTPEGVRREPMSKIRQRIAQRLVSVQQTAAMLTTFNEADMSGIFDLRTKYKERFQEVHGISLGLMSFFVCACALSLQEFPEVNARIDGADIVYHDHVHMGIAVEIPKSMTLATGQTASPTRNTFSGLTSRCTMPRA